MLRNAMDRAAFEAGRETLAGSGRKAEVEAMAKNFPEPLSKNFGKNFSTQIKAPKQFTAKVFRKALKSNPSFRSFGKIALLSTATSRSEEHTSELQSHFPI